MNNLLKKAILIILICSFNTSAFSLSSEWSHAEVSKVRLISPFTNNNNQDEFILGLQYKMDPGWKTYWKSPGDGGFAQDLLWEKSTNINNIEIEWPKPKSFEILDLDTIGYEDEVIFPLVVNIKDKSKITNIDMSINYLVCKDICIPGIARIFLDIPAGKAKTTEHYHLIEKTKSSLPQTSLVLSFINNFDSKAYKKDNNILLEVKAETSKYFQNPNIFIHTPFGLPIDEYVIDYSLENKSLIASFNFDSNLFTEEIFDIEVLLTDKNHNFLFNNEVKLEKFNQNKFFEKKFYIYLLISFLGGLILNIMPCVLPILSIKLMSIITNDHQKARSSFLITSFGIISSFILLGLSFLFLQSLNIPVSWGMQFQQPYFLMIITSIIFLFMMNLFNQFEFQIPNFVNRIHFIKDSSNSYSKDFFNGFFATILATPCSAPFVGTAITAAFTQHSVLSISIFFFMGFGMSVPYIAIALFPKLITFLPKPGKWMQYVKYFLGFLLLLTTVWLSNILLNFFNYYFLISIFLLLLILIYLRKVQFFKNSFSVMILLIFFSLPLFDIFQQQQDKQTDQNWLNFNFINIDELIIDNNIVFIDITADWCATCQYNKINVLNKKEVKDIFKKNNIILVRGDWTKPNEKINEFLNKYNRFGIPFNAFYSKKFNEGILLSELLSEKEILNNINKINND